MTAKDDAGGLPVPDEHGWYWARSLIEATGWEVVNVIESGINLSGAFVLGVLVCGCETVRRLEDFEWGNRVTRSGCCRSIRA